MLVTRRLKVALETSAQAWDAPTSCSFFLGADWRKVNQDFLSLHSPSDWMLIYKMQKHICQIFKDNLIIFLGFWGFFCIKITWLSCLFYCTAPAQHDSASTSSVTKLFPCSTLCCRFGSQAALREREVRQLYFVSLSMLKWCPSQGKQHHLQGRNYAAILQHSQEAACRPRCSLRISILLKPLTHTHRGPANMQTQHFKTRTGIFKIQVLAFTSFGVHSSSNLRGHSQKSTCVTASLSRCHVRNLYLISNT